MHGDSLPPSNVHEPEVQHQTVHARAKCLLFALILGCLPVLASYYGITERIEPTLAETWFSVRGPRETPQSVSLVQLDYLAYDEVDRSVGEMFPRDRLAEVVDAVASAGATAVVVDLSFQRPWKHAPGDESLAAALARTPSVIGVMAKPLDIAPDEETPLVSVFTSSATEVVSLDLPDKDVVRRISLAQAQGDSVPLLAPLRRFVSTDLARPGEFDFINYYGGRATLVSLSAEQMLSSEPVDPDYLHDRIVFIGVFGGIHFGLQPRYEFSTAYDGEATPGVEILATIAANLIDGSWIRRLSPRAETGVMALAMFVAGYFVIAAGALVAPLLATAFIALWLGASYFAFCILNFFLPGLTLVVVTAPLLLIHAVYATHVLAAEARQSAESGSLMAAKVQ